MHSLVVMPINFGTLHYGTFRIVLNMCLGSNSCSHKEDTLPLSYFQPWTFCPLQVPPSKKNHNKDFSTNTQAHPTKNILHKNTCLKTTSNLLTGLCMLRTKQHPCKRKMRLGEETGLHQNPQRLGWEGWAWGQSSVLDQVCTPHLTSRVSPPGLFFFFLDVQKRKAFHNKAAWNWVWRLV